MKQKIPLPIKLLAIFYTTEGTEENKKNTITKQPKLSPFHYSAHDFRKHKPKTTKLSKY
jgi:hypothetical protein